MSSSRKSQTLRGTLCSQKMIQCCFDALITRNAELLKLKLVGRRNREEFIFCALTRASAEIYYFIPLSIIVSLKSCYFLFGKTDLKDSLDILKSTVSHFNKLVSQCQNCNSYKIFVCKLSAPRRAERERAVCTI